MARSPTLQVLLEQGIVMLPGGGALFGVGLALDAGADERGDGELGALGDGGLDGQMGERVRQSLAARLYGHGCALEDGVGLGGCARGREMLVGEYVEEAYVVPLRRDGHVGTVLARLIELADELIEERLGQAFEQEVVCKGFIGDAVEH